MSLRRLRARGERGATLILVAISIAALFTIVAIVIDLGAVRSQRRTGQAATDSATAAAGAALAESDAQAACQDALDFLRLNLDVPAFTGGNCATFLSACADTVPRTTTASSQEFTATIVHPVVDASPLMGGTGIGGPTQPGTASDGAPCDRIGVQLDVDGNTFFGGVVGIADYNTTVHAVSRVNSGNSDTRPLNLLLLDRTNCRTIRATGQARLIVEAPFDPSLGPSGEFVAGIAAADSNGTINCNGGRGIIESTSGGAFPTIIRADGPCPSDPTMTNGCGDGEGTIEVFGSQGLIDGSCDGSPSEAPSCRGFDDASIVPNVRASLGQFTRAPIDYRYNCKPDYSTEPWYSTQDIPGCSDPMSGAYIDTLKSFASGINDTTPGWTTITDCNPPDPTIHPPGNYFVNCSNYQVQGLVEFQGGNIVFDGDISLTAAGDLRTNTCVSPVVCGSITWTPGSPFTPVQAAQSSEDAAWVYVKGNPPGNSISKASQASIEFDHTLLLLESSTDGVSLSGGGGGSLVWIAPEDGPFDDLALWSESTGDIGFSGQSVLTLEGVFFTPVAEVVYTGQGGQQQADAQFIALRMRVAGQGEFGILPAPGRSVEFPIDPTAGLIR